MKVMSDKPYNAAPLSSRLNEWKAGWVPGASTAEPGILNCTARRLREQFRSIGRASRYMHVMKPT
jgi:hypothetical protein